MRAIAREHILMVIHSFIHQVLTDQDDYVYNTLLRTALNAEMHLCSQSLDAKGTNKL